MTPHRAFKCADDTEALTWAKQLFDGYQIELWSGERFIARVDRKLDGTAHQYPAESSIAALDGARRTARDADRDRNASRIIQGIAYQSASGGA